MRKSIRFAATFFALAAVPAYAADQFDLVCAEPNSKEGVRLRIDLTAGEWCDGECRHIRKIANSTSGTIVLQELKYSDQVPIEHVINRMTGEYRIRMILRNSGPTYIRQTCQPAPFSAIPRDQAKF